MPVVAKFNHRVERGRPARPNENSRALPIQIIQVEGILRPGTGRTMPQHLLGARSNSICKNLQIPEIRAQIAIPSIIRCSLTSRVLIATAKATKLVEPSLVESLWSHRQETLTWLI